MAHYKRYMRCHHHLNFGSLSATPEDWLCGLGSAYRPHRSSYSVNFDTYPLFALRLNRFLRQTGLISTIVVSLDLILYLFYVCAGF